jgi:ubiquinone/menaquinone biosynthesis C-methylase UbiE
MVEQQEIYKYLWSAHASDGDLDNSLSPRSSDLLFDVVAGLGIDRTWSVLDVGCGRGNHACELASRFQCEVKGLEPVESNLQLCRESAIEWNVSDQVEFVQGTIEAIPFGSSHFDLLWCRDMLVHVQNLKLGLQECQRVLRPSGMMLILTTFATDLMEPQEKHRLCQALGLASNNLSPIFMEQTFLEGGFRVVSADWLGSELAEFYEERDGRYSRELRRIARMTRKKKQLEAQMGQSNFEVSLALYNWGIYQLLGKLGLMVYTLKKAE